MGLSSQVGDLSAFFLVTGLSILFALTSRNGLWYYPSVMLLLAAAIGRTIAWLFHGAAFAPLLIAFEIGVGLLLLLASKTLPTRE